MRIALDFDGCYTEDPALWDKFIESCRDKHDIWCVTMRYPTEKVDIGIPVIYTSRKAKKIHCSSIGMHFDIWIDDSPEWLFKNG